MASSVRPRPQEVNDQGRKFTPTWNHQEKKSIRYHQSTCCPKRRSIVSIREKQLGLRAKAVENSPRTKQRRLNQKQAGLKRQSKMATDTKSHHEPFHLALPMGRRVNGRNITKRGTVRKRKLKKQLKPVWLEAYRPYHCRKCRKMLPGGGLKGWNSTQERKWHAQNPCPGSYLWSKATLPKDQLPDPEQIDQLEQHEALQEYLRAVRMPIEERRARQLSERDITKPLKQKWVTCKFENRLQIIPPAPPQIAVPSPSQVRKSKAARLTIVGGNVTM